MSSVSTGDGENSIVIAPSSVSTGYGENSIVIAPPADEPPMFVERSIPVVHLVNATPYKITSVDLTTEGNSDSIVKNIPAYQTLECPDYIFKLPQAHSTPQASNFTSNPVTVNFDESKSFTLTVNISSALKSSNAVVLYIFQRGIVVATNNGDLRAVDWVS